MRVTLRGLTDNPMLRNLYLSNPPYISSPIWDCCPAPIKGAGQSVVAEHSSVYLPISIGAYDSPPVGLGVQPLSSVFWA